MVMVGPYFLIWATCTIVLESMTVLDIFAVIDEKNVMENVGMELENGSG